MITPARLKTYKEQALAAIASRVKNPKAPGVSCVVVTPHDLLDLILMFEETLTTKGEQK